MSGEQKGIRILHVDDEPSFLALTKAFLEREHEDFCVDTAISAEEGLEHLKSGRYDVVLSDYQMPMMDGLEFLQKLREPGNTVPFIMFTGKGREEVAIEALNKGANRYIQKGVDIGSMFGTLAHSIQDVVAKNRAGEALKESEERYRLLFNRGNDAVFLHEVSVDGVPGKILDVNDTACDLLGYTKEELLQLSHLDLVAPEQMKRVPTLREKLQANRSNLFEIVAVTKYGKKINFEINHHLFNLNGQPTVLAIARDITNRNETTQELEKRRIYLESVLGCAPDAIITLDAQHHILEWNNGAEKLFGYSPEEAKGQNLDDLVTGSHASTVDEATSLTRQVLAGESVPPTETVRYQKDGTPVDVIAAGSPIKIGDEVIGLVAVYTDLTERKQAENALLESEEKFKAIVEDAPFGISIMNPDMRFEFFNAEFTTMFGYTLEDLPDKKTWFGKAYPDEEYRKKVVTVWKEEVIENSKVGEIPSRVFKVRCQDGQDKVINFKTVLFENGKNFVTYQDITTQTKAKEALKESEREHQILLDHVPVSLFHIDRNSEFVRVNEALAKHYGMKPEDFIGKSTSELFPEEAESFIENDKKVLECGEPHIGEIRKIIQPQGVRWVQLDKVPLKDAEGNVTGIIGFELDITERKRALEELRKREKEHKIVLDSVPVGIFHIDANGRFIEVNEALAERYQLTAEQMIGKSTRELFPDVAEEYLKSDSEVLARGEPQIGITRKNKTPDGVRWVRLDKVPIKDADGNVTGIIGFELDITKRMQTQEELRNAQKKFWDIIEFLPDATFVVDHDKKVIAWNRAMEEMTGIQKEDMIGKGDYEYAIPFYGERRPILTDLVFASDKEIESRYTHVGKNGNALFAEIFAAPIYGGKGAYLWGIATPLFDSEGNVIGAIESIRDISDRKQAEKDRKRLVEELEAKNTELERFTYTVSHDLRSPLVTIQGFTDMAREDLEHDEREKAKNDLKYIANAATKMDRLLQDTLQLSRIGCVTNPPEYVPFGDLVDDALEQTAGELKANNIDVSVAEDFPSVHVDRMRIVEVLVNFITNSIKYRGEQPTPKIEIGYRSEGKETVFFVLDNGIGIDESAHEKVFELFYRADKSGEGTGAGLAIVKRIIEVHKGRIWIESEKGTGTTVCFTLPVQ